MTLTSKINKIPDGYSEGFFEGAKYGITKHQYNNGKSVKIYAKELGGKNFISLNYYVTSQKAFLRPCEMPEQKVLHFLATVKIMKEIQFKNTRFDPCVTPFQDLGVKTAKAHGYSADLAFEEKNC